MVAEVGWAGRDGLVKVEDLYEKSEEKQKQDERQLVFWKIKQFFAAFFESKFIFGGSPFKNRETRDQEDRDTGDDRQPIDGELQSGIGEKNKINADDAESERKNEFFQGVECLVFSENRQKQKTAGQEHDQGQR